MQRTLPCASDLQVSHYASTQQKMWGTVPVTKDQLFTRIVVSRHANWSQQIAWVHERNHCKSRTWQFFHQSLTKINCCHTIVSRRGGGKSDNRDNRRQITCSKRLQMNGWETEMQSITNLAEQSCEISLYWQLKLVTGMMKSNFVLLELSSLVNLVALNCG